MDMKLFLYPQNLYYCPSTNVFWKKQQNFMPTKINNSTVRDFFLVIPC